MIVLEDEKKSIVKFIINSVATFKNQEGNFNSIGIYCCPWAGWISLSFNVKKLPADTSNNCPDFEFVGFEFLELKTWEQEYEGPRPIYRFKGETIALNYDLADEVLNELFFIFLSTIVLDIKNNIKESILLQMLDSKFNKVF